MTRITNIGSRLGSGGSSRLGSETRAASERDRLARRERTVPWRAWYRSDEWLTLRAMAIARDSAYCPTTGRMEPRCRRTGVWLLGKRPEPNSPVVDHVVPHEGDRRLFFDLANLQTVAKGWHDKIKQARERRHDRAAFHPEWLEPSRAELTIVCGPPASGKSTWVAAKAGPADVVIDLDVIASEISGEPLHGWNRDKWLNAALFRRNDLLGDLSRASSRARAWFIVGEPKASGREWWANKLKPASIVVIAAPPEVCRMRTYAEGGRDVERAERAIARWWCNYQPRTGDVTINTLGNPTQTPQGVGGANPSRLSSPHPRPLHGEI